VREKWDVPREEVVKELAAILALRDPELTLEAAKVFAAMDAINVKRDELEMKREAKDNEHKLRLLELARRAPANELAKLASENGIITIEQQR
jgi:hypothetical protein